MLVDVYSSILVTSALGGGVGLLAAHDWIRSEALKARFEKRQKQVELMVSNQQKLIDQLTSHNQLQAKEIERHRPAIQQRARLDAALEEMKNVWLDHQTLPKVDPGNLNEKSCETVLRKNLWVLQPDFIPTGYINSNNQTPIKSILTQHFGGPFESEPNCEYILSKTTWRPDVCGWFHSCGIQPNGEWTKELSNGVYVIIELKHSREPLTIAPMEQCYAYAMTMVRCYPQLADQRIECIVICGNPNESEIVHPIETRLGPTQQGRIRITPMTYAQLYERALRMVAGIDGAGSAIDTQADVISFAEEKALRVAGQDK